MHKSNGLAKNWHTRKTTLGLRCVFMTVVFVSRLCGARSVQCFSVVVEMMVLVFVSSVVAVMVGELCVVFLKGGPLDDERKGHSRSEVSQFWGVSGFLVWETGHVWPMQSDGRECCWWC